MRLEKIQIEAILGFQDYVICIVVRRLQTAPGGEVRGWGVGGESTFFMGLLTENSTKLELYLNYKEPGAKNKLMRWECFLYTDIRDMQCGI